LSGRFSFTINFCATQLLANPCREVEQLPKNVARVHCGKPDDLKVKSRVATSSKTRRPRSIRTSGMPWACASPAWASPAAGQPLP
jgi:hypothetical protein